jgi:hypothetical protein
MERLRWISLSHSGPECATDMSVTRALLRHHLPDRCTSFRPSHNCQLSSFVACDDHASWSFLLLPMALPRRAMVVGVFGASMAREVWVMADDVSALLRAHY